VNDARLVAGPVERNRLLEMAGLASFYPEGDLATDDLAPFQQVIDRPLASHDPFPGFLVDRHWNLVEGNRAATVFFGGDQHPNLVRLALEDWRPHRTHLPGRRPVRALLPGPGGNSIDHLTRETNGSPTFGNLP
jgi:hypothetical protein